MGITEEAGGVAKRGLQILSGAPMLFALIVINFATLGMTTYLVASAIDNRAKERAQVLDLLQKCYKSEKIQWPLLFEK
jgi:hypothetical protein